MTTHELLVFLIKPKLDAHSRRVDICPTVVEQYLLSREHWRFLGILEHLGAQARSHPETN